MADTDVRKVPPPPPPKKISLKHLSTDSEGKIISPGATSATVKDQYSVSSSDSECEGPPPKINIGRVDLTKLKTDLLVVKDDHERTATDLELVHAHEVKAKWEKGEVETAQVDADGNAAARQAEMEELKKTSLKQRFSVEEADAQNTSVFKKQASEEEPDPKLAGKARRKFQIIDAKVAKQSGDNGHAKRNIVQMKQSVEKDTDGADGTGQDAKQVTESESISNPFLMKPSQSDQDATEMELRNRKTVTFTPSTEAPKAAIKTPLDTTPILTPQEIEEISWGNRKANALKEKGKRRKQVVKIKIKILTYVMMALVFALIVILIIRFFQK